MAKDKDPFPRWDEPAIKGDVIAALVEVRACVVDIYLALKAIEKGQAEKLSALVKSLDENDEKLSSLINQISGREETVDE